MFDDGIVVMLQFLTGIFIFVAGSTFNAALITNDCKHIGGFHSGKDTFICELKK